MIPRTRNEIATLRDRIAGARDAFETGPDRIATAGSKERSCSTSGEVSARANSVAHFIQGSLHPGEVGVYARASSLLQG